MRPGKAKCAGWAERGRRDTLVPPFHGGLERQRRIARRLRGTPVAIHRMQRDAHGTARPPRWCANPTLPASNRSRLRQARRSREHDLGMKSRGILTLWLSRDTTDHSKARLGTTCRPEGDVRPPSSRQSWTLPPPFNVFSAKTRRTRVSPGVQPFPCAIVSGRRTGSRRRETGCAAQWDHARAS